MTENYAPLFLNWLKKGAVEENKKPYARLLSLEKKPVSYPVPWNGIETLTFTSESCYGDVTCFYLGVYLDSSEIPTLCLDLTPRVCVLKGDTVVIKGIKINS